MNFLHYSTSDCRGGAAQHAFDLHRMLRNQGHGSRMVVRQKLSTDGDVIEVPVTATQYRLQKLRSLAKRVQRKNEACRYYTFNYDEKVPFSAAALCPVPCADVDIVCIHWITGLLTTRMVSRVYQYYKRPIVWMLMDQEPITGGCHYSFGCRGYERQCGNCPQLDPPSEHDASRRVWERKKRWLGSLPISFRCASRASAANISRSSIFGSCPVFVNPGPVSDTVFRPIDRLAARVALGVPPDKKFIFFGASVLDDTRKGIPLLVDALNQVHAAAGTLPVPADGIALLVAGLGGSAIKDSLPFAMYDLDLIRDERLLALAYQASDLFLCSSLDDEGPLMISQSMMCGTPVVTFPTRQALDLIVNGKNGFCCRENKSEQLAEGILALLRREDLGAIGQQAWQTAHDTVAPRVFGRRFLEICEQVVDAHNARGMDE